MLRGIYTAASGMVAQQHRLDAISNNMANADQTGYKKDISVMRSFPQMLIRRFNDNGVRTFPIGSVDSTPIVGKLGTGVQYDESYTNFSQGSLKESSNPFDIALQGEGFFVIDTPQGERFSRNGTFHLGKEGQLLTKEGFPVMGEKGPINIKLNNFTIDKLGRVFHNKKFEDNPYRLVSDSENEWEDLELLDTIRVVDFRDKRFLKKEGSSLYNNTEVSGEAVNMSAQKRPGVMQGFLEASNINPVKEMVSMIEVNRAYEACQKSISAHDNTLGKLIDQVARF